MSADESLDSGKSSAEYIDRVNQTIRFSDIISPIDMPSGAQRQSRSHPGSTFSRPRPSSGSAFSQTNLDLEQVADIDSGELPADYFARTSTTIRFFDTISPIDMPSGAQRQSRSHPGSTFSQLRPSFGSAVSDLEQVAEIDSGE